MFTHFERFQTNSKFRLVLNIVKTINNTPSLTVFYNYCKYVLGLHLCRQSTTKTDVCNYIWIKSFFYDYYSHRNNNFLLCSSIQDPVKRAGNSIEWIQIILSNKLCRATQKLQRVHSPHFTTQLLHPSPSSQYLFPIRQKCITLLKQTLNSPRWSNFESNNFHTVENFCFFSVLRINVASSNCLHRHLDSITTQNARNLG